MEYFSAIRRIHRVGNHMVNLKIIVLSERDRQNIAHTAWVSLCKILENGTNLERQKADQWLSEHGVGQGAEGGREKLWITRKLWGGCSLPWEWWWFHGCIRMPKFIKTAPFKQVQFMICQLYLNRGVRTNPRRKVGEARGENEQRNWHVVSESN